MRQIWIVNVQNDAGPMLQQSLLCLCQGKSLGDVMKAGAGEARSLVEATETLLRIQAGLAIRNPPKKPQKTT